MTELKEEDEISGWVFISMQEKFALQKNYSQSINFRINCLLLCRRSTRFRLILVNPVERFAVMGMGLIKSYYWSRAMQLKEEVGNYSIMEHFLRRSLRIYYWNASGGRWIGGCCLAITPSLVDVEEGRPLGRGHKVDIWSRIWEWFVQSSCHSVRFGMKDFVPTLSGPRLEAQILYVGIGINWTTQLPPEQAKSLH